MGLKCGIVGLPNVGKSTLFNALTHSSVAAENYPFCTIDPNIGRVAVPDERLTTLSTLVQPAQCVPAYVEFVDIAGLVQYAAQGEGLGNYFLSHIREAQIVAHVVRCFPHQNVTDVADPSAPIHDVSIIHTELCLADLELAQRALEKTLKRCKSGDREAAARRQALERLIAHLDEGNPARTLHETEGAEDWEILADLRCLTAKPMFYIANVVDAGTSPDTDPVLASLAALAAQESTVVIPVSAPFEVELAQLDEVDRQEFLQDAGLSAPGLDRVVRTAYRLLGLHTYFTAGPKAVQAWTIPLGAKAPQAAACIHSDFERGFIRAEVVTYEDYLAYKGEQGAKAAGRWRSEGRDYVVQDGDVILFRYNL